MRQKSNRTLLIEQERAARIEERKRKKAEKERDKKIREDRRERKQAEQEAKREVRLEKQRVHESVERNGAPKIRPEESHFGLREAMEHFPLVDCSRCHVIVRELYGTLCERCHYSKEVNDQGEKELKTRGNKAVPGQGDGGNGTITLAGQVMLGL
ncbi:MAG: hypothetical protein MUP28_00155 [Candidatus Aminicenantes bacterium]|nr:hypothetical protein [Candidatus Aminicenantes bacterium]